MDVCKTQFLGEFYLIYTIQKPTEAMPECDSDLSYNKFYSSL